jgi:hypothetical protein
VALLRRTGRIGWRQAAGAFGLWLALGWVVALASVRGLVARQGAFLRTPKVRGDVSWRDALRGNVVESLLAVLCLAGAVTGFAAAATGTGSGLVVGVLLLLQGGGYAAAPLNSLAAVRADLTPELRRRRREALLSWTRVAPGVRRWGIGPVLATAAAASAVVLFAGPVGAPRLDELPGHARPQTAGKAVKPRATEVPVPTQSSLVPLSPLSPLLSTAITSSASSSAAAKPVVAGPTRPTAAPSTRPTRAPTTPTAVPTTQPTQASTTHGRPTRLPTPTRRPR